ncbi:hypothetical protein CPB83DRAFT_496633 [Crepidotus variabilis]|uniref:Uncharacterized protein n=1 Tax=Crepidotus variabilis TaxID=179855 RepID=A0A9P6JMK4_9AGAR|nr:hypothetical protein CPB83DRAFT_496633 [Crepidotus variabilis]
MSAPISKSTNVAGQPSDNDVRVNKELQDALQDFLSLDLEMLKNEAIPFETRTGAAKNATSKVLNAFNKLDPILNEFEVNKGSVSKETQDIHAALKDTKVQFKDLDVTLKNVRVSSSSTVKAIFRVFSHRFYIYIIRSSRRMQTSIPFHSVAGLTMSARLLTWSRNLHKIPDARL